MTTLTPPPGYRLLTEEEYGKPTPEGTIFWNAYSEQWNKREMNSLDSCPAFIYAIPITPTVPATGDTTNEKGGEPCASTMRNAPVTAFNQDQLIQGAQPTDASNAALDVRSVEQRQETLLPCPFCGSAPRSYDVNGETPDGEGYGYWAVECPKCNGGEYGRFCGVHGEDKEDAETNWNTRK